MSSRGVSKEEKKTRLLQLFYERGECFQLKELEKVAPKAKGIVANSVKEILQILVEDGMVDTDKIGTSVYFWAFPSKAFTSKKRKLDELQRQYDQSCKKLKVLEQAVTSLEDDKDADKKRDKIIDEIQEKDVKLLEMKNKLKQHVENDPEKVERMEKKTQELRDAANRWTDNIFAIRSWCKKKFMTEDDVLNRQFGIPKDFDYIE